MMFNSSGYGGVHDDLSCNESDHSRLADRAPCNPEIVVSLNRPCEGVRLTETVATKAMLERQSARQGLRQLAIEFDH
jgi:hypothetical protein